MGENNTDRKTVETIIALAVVVASFMYLHEFILIQENRMDMLLGLFVFAGGIIYLFSNIWRK